MDSPEAGRTGRHVALSARHAACRFNVASAAPGYLVWNSTTASAQTPRPGSVPLSSAAPAAPPPLRHCGLHGRAQHHGAPIKPLRLAGGYCVARRTHLGYKVFGIQHNAAIMRSTSCCPARARIIGIMCKWPHLKGNDPRAARGASAAARLPLPVLAPRFPPFLNRIAAHDGRALRAMTGKAHGYPKN